MPPWPYRWQGRWIWGERPSGGPGPLDPAGLPPPQTWNRFWHLRRTLALDRVPDSVPARFTADSRFVLWVNGREVARGPARSQWPRLAYAEAELAPLLREGRNAVAVLVRFYGRPGPWWVPATPSGEIGFGSWVFEAPAIGIASDKSWRCLPGAWRQDVPASPWLPYAPLEILDGAAHPQGWTGAGFDDGGWTHAVELSGAVLAARVTEVPCDPFPLLEPDDLAALSTTPRSLREIASATFAPRVGDDPLGAYPDDGTTSADGHRYTVYEADGVTLGTPRVRVRGEADAVVDLYTGEDLRPDGLPNLPPRMWAMRYTLRGGETEEAEAYEGVGFRYLAVAVRGEATVESVDAVERHYPRATDGAWFSCGDDELDAIWALGPRTLDLCSTDAFLDCPAREQRAWLGDAYLTTLVSLVCQPDVRLVRRNLRIHAWGQRPDGLLPMVACGDFGLRATTIPDFSLHWVRGLARAWEYTGDEDLVRELWPAAARVLDAFERYRAPDGLLRGVPSWVFVDWAMTERAEVTGVLDALYAAALTDAAAVLDVVVGDRSGAAMLRSRADRTREAFELLWDEERGVYVDAADADGPRRRVSQQTIAMAVVSGCAPPERWDRVLDVVLDPERVVITPTMATHPDAYFRGPLDPQRYVDFDPERHVVGAQPFFRHFVHDALVRAGRRDAISESCRDWAHYLRTGHGTVEEFWDAPPGLASRCHVWAATPTYDLTTHMLGLRPLEPGWAEAGLEPRFGSFDRLLGRVPTPRGPIDVDLTPEGGTVSTPVPVRFAFEGRVGRGRIESGVHRLGVRR